MPLAAAASPIFIGRPTTVLDLPIMGRSISGFKSLTRRMPMHHRLGIAVIVAAFAIPPSLAVAHDADQSASFGAPGEAAQVSRTIAITMNDMSFAPAMLAVTSGETIRFVVSNKSAIDHEFAL